MSDIVEQIAAEYMLLIEEGWTPDLDEFLGRVPEEHRDACAFRIEELSAPKGPVKLTREEARAMFREMELAAASR
ncbi:MAG: hypothetical protein ACYTGN_09955 [Planctomycetota bacterium]|jgi:hypothetical protein